MKRRALLVLLPLLAAMGSASADAPPPEVVAELPGARLQGQGRMTFVGLAVYDIRLWTTGSFDPGHYDAKPLALELIYARRLEGAKIAERSIKEMHRVGDFSEAQSQRWLAQMGQAFPDVKSADRLTGVLRPGVGVRFFVNGARPNDIDGADFARLFFGIWLSPQTSEPGLRNALLGTAAG